MPTQRLCSLEISDTAAKGQLLIDELMIEDRIFVFVKGRFVDPGINAIQKDVDKVGLSEVFLAGDALSFV